MHTYMHVGVVYVCMGMWRPEFDIWCPHQLFLVLVFDRFSLNLKLTDWADQLASKPKGPPSVPPSAAVTG